MLLSAFIFRDGAYWTVCMTNELVTDTEIVTPLGDIEISACKYILEFFPCRTELPFDIPERTLQKIPVDVTPGVILELPARQTLVCNVC